MRQPTRRSAAASAARSPRRPAYGPNHKRSSRRPTRDERPVRPWACRQSCPREARSPAARFPAPGPSRAKGPSRPRGGLSDTPTWRPNPPPHRRQSASGATASFVRGGSTATVPFRFGPRAICEDADWQVPFAGEPRLFRTLLPKAHGSPATLGRSVKCIGQQAATATTETPGQDYSRH